jgi:hypothetical protein
MAVKKTKASAPKKAVAKKTAPKKSAVKKSAPKKAAKTTVGKAPKKAAPKKKAAAVKLSDKQVGLLKKVKDSGVDGLLGSKADSKGLESLQTKKLIKRGTKDKASGHYRYSVSKTGEKHLSAPPPAPKG